MLARVVSMMVLIALGWTQLGAAYHLSCRALELAHAGSDAATGATSTGHDHGGHASPEISDDKGDTSPRSDCPLLMHGQGCAATAIPVTTAAAPEPGPTGDRASGTVTESIDLLLARSILRPPQA